MEYHEEGIYLQFFKAISNVFKLIFISDIISSMDLLSMKTDVSSANDIENILVDSFDRALMYKMKSSGPRTDPCGILHVIVFHLLCYYYYYKSTKHYTQILT